jgi:hypothetical protein
VSGGPGVSEGSVSDGLCRMASVGWPLSEGLGAEVCAEVGAEVAETRPLQGGERSCAAPNYRFRQKRRGPPPFRGRSTREGGLHAVCWEEDVRPPILEHAEAYSGPSMQFVGRIWCAAPENVVLKL